MTQGAEKKPLSKSKREPVQPDPGNARTNKEMGQRSMSVPPSMRALFPSFRMNGGFVSINISDLKKHFPSLELTIGGNKLIFDGELRMSIYDMSRLLRMALANVHIDEAWYFAEVPELRKDIQKGSFKS